jgi:fatty acid desaturase
MPRRDPREARVLGLWTAAWLAVLLLAGLLWLGDLSLQWPVLAVPVLWALIALRPRRHRGPASAWEVLPAPARTDTVERPVVRRRPDRPDRPDRRGKAE